MASENEEDFDYNMEYLNSPTSSVASNFDSNPLADDAEIDETQEGKINIL